MIGLRWQAIALLFYGCAAMAIGAYVVDLKWQSDWDAHILADAQANQKASDEALKKQQDLQMALEDAYDKIKVMQDDHKRHMVDASHAAERLRNELDRIKALPKVSNPSPIAERANAATDRIVLANLLAISDARAGEYAEHADAHRIALQACHNEYNTIRGLK